MSLLARSSSRLARVCQRTQFRRNMSGGAEDHHIPGIDWKGEIYKGIALGVVLGLGWKAWQWQDKAGRVSRNNAWEKQFPYYAAQVKAKLDAAAAEKAAEEEGEAASEEPAAEEEAAAESA